MNEAYFVREPVFRFGPFELIPARRFLSKYGRAVRVGSRALDLLVALVENAGKVVDKRELIARVWHNVIVDEGNIRVHISALRRLLGDDGMESRYIVHVARRGYIFVAPLVLQSDRRIVRQEPGSAPLALLRFAEMDQEIKGEGCLDYQARAQSWT